ncbi:MAG TPA: peptide ABC transporter substrate-binding protein [Opitutaceae bacterium]|nr:peptide ABC transporter substrate-binding protein [Opitutaceae bacterium]
MRLRRLLPAVLACVLLASCRRAAPAPSGPAVLRISQRNEPDDLDPALAALPDDFFVIRALSEGLVVPNPDGGDPLPAAAQGWEISSHGLTWTFRLRADGRWSDGEPVTAADFVESYRRALTPATAAPKAELFFGVKNARDFLQGRLTEFSAVGFLAPDPHTLVVELEHPMPQFLAYAASGPWIPVNPRVVARLGKAWTRAGNFVGNGPFTLAEWTLGRRIVVRKNPLYYGAAGVRMNEIQFIRLDDGDTEERAFRAGQVDVTMSLPFTRLQAYAQESNPALHRAVLAETRYLAFNTTKAPFSDHRVRRALSVAIDRERLARDVTRGGEHPAYRLLPPQLRPAGDMGADLSGSRFAESAAEAWHLQNRAAALDEARRLLAEAGFPGGRGFPHFELTGWAGTQQVVLEAIQAMWKDALGIEAAVATREARVHFAALRAGHYDVGLSTLIPDVDDPVAALQRFATAAPDNYPHWSDPEFDLQMAAAEIQPAPAQQAAMLRTAESRLLAEAPIAPLYYFAHNWLMSPALRGWHEDALWTRDYRGVYWPASP